jgi:hypothetical protein
MEHEESSLKTLQDTIERVSKELSKHEHQDMKNMEYVKSHIPDQTHLYREDSKMGLENVSDKININLGDGASRGGNDGGAMAALVAALGTRNQGGDHAGLIAALGNRNDSGANLAPLLAMMHNRNDGDGNGMGGMWPLLLLLLLGRGGHGGGLFGGGDGDGNANGAGSMVLQSLANLQSQIPTVALENQNAILGAIARSDLGIQQGFANTKDAVQNTLLALSSALATVNQNVSEQGCQTREYVGNDGDKTRAQQVARWQLEDATRINEQNAEILALRTKAENDHRHHESTLQITNTNTAVAAQSQYQQQQQQQFQIDSSLERAVGRIVGSFNQTMLARQGQDIVNLGTMTASGTQAAANTQVR